MKEKPILFSAPMVQAIQAGTKNQTRRTAGLEKVNENPNEWKSISMTLKSDSLLGTQNDKYGLTFNFRHKTEMVMAKCSPRFHVGDHIWVRETFRHAQHYGFDYPLIEYRAGGTNAHCEIADPEQLIPSSNWKPSLFMKKIVTRIWLECTGVRCERAQDITEADAINEGITFDSTVRLYKCPVCVLGHHKGNELLCYDGFFIKAKMAFQSLWHSINGVDSWNQNPWVFIYEFKVIKK
jgi:hypothetical protein